MNVARSVKKAAHQLRHRARRAQRAQRRRAIGKTALALGVLVAAGAIVRYRMA